MADSAAVRQRRKRAHDNGDHSMCVAGRCEALGGPRRPPRANATPPRVVADASPPVAPAVAVPPADFDDGRVPGGIEQAVLAFVASLPYQDGDPRRILGTVAVRLARRVDDTGAVPAAVRELRVMLLQLAEVPNGPAGVVDEMRVRHHQQQLDMLLAQAAA